MHNLVSALVKDELEPLTNQDLLVHLNAYRDRQHIVSMDAAHGRQKRALPWACALLILFAFAEGTLAEHLREHDFRWGNYDERWESIAKAIAQVLERSSLGEKDDPRRLEGLETLARQMVRVALAAIDVPVPKDLFRGRRSRC